MSAASRLSVVLAAAAAFVLAAPAGAGQARARLDKALRSLDDAKVSFTQTRTSSVMGSSMTPAKGTLEFKAPRLLRLDFGGAVPTTILVRGDTAWLAQPKAGQVIRTSARASGAPPLPFLEESVAVLEQGYVLKETGPNAITLTPRATAVPFRAVDLVLDAKSGLPTRVVVRQKDDEQVRLEFGRWTVNGGLAAARFAPEFGPGARIVDL